MADENEFGINPPPELSTPKETPWVQLENLNKNLNALVQLMQQNAAGGIQGFTPGGAIQTVAPTITVLPASFGTPGSSSQMINVMLENTSGALGAGATLPFKKSVPAETQDELDRNVIRDSIVDAVLMLFPAGCHNLVEVNLVYHPVKGSKQYIIPSVEDSSIALDDVAALFHPNTPIKAPGKLRVEWWNYDTLNSHEVVVIASLRPTNLLGG